MSLGPEFSDENFLEETCKNSAFSVIYNFQIEKPSRKPLENVEIVQKSSSKDIQRTQVIEAHTHLSLQKRIFNDTDLFQDMIRGKYYQFPRNCLDFYDTNIDSFEVVSQNNNIYNLSGNAKKVNKLRHHKINYYEPIIMYETCEDNFKAWKEEPRNNFFKETIKKNEILNKTLRKNKFDKENSFESDPKEIAPNPILTLKKSVENQKLNEKSIIHSKIIYEDMDHRKKYDELSPEREFSRISSARIADKLIKSQENKSYLQNNLNSSELNSLTENVYLKMSKQKGIFDISEDEFGSKFHESHYVDSKMRFNGSHILHSNYAVLNKSKGKSPNKIFDDSSNNNVFLNNKINYE